MDSPKFIVQRRLAENDSGGHDWEDTAWAPNDNSLVVARTEFPEETYRVVMVVDENMESHLG